MKTCTRCKAYLALSEFYTNGRTKDGRQAWCKKCVLEYQQERNLRLKQEKFLASQEALQFRIDEALEVLMDVKNSGASRITLIQLQAAFEKRLGVTIDFDIN